MWVVKKVSEQWQTEFVPADTIYSPFHFHTQQAADSYAACRNSVPSHQSTLDDIQLVGQPIQTWSDTYPKRLGVVIAIRPVVAVFVCEPVPFWIGERLYWAYALMNYPPVLDSLTLWLWLERIIYRASTDDVSPELARRQLNRMFRGIDLLGWKTPKVRQFQQVIDTGIIEYEWLFQQFRSIFD